MFHNTSCLKITFLTIFVTHLRHNVPKLNQLLPMKQNAFTRRFTKVEKKNTNVCNCKFKA